jgi:DNA-binding NarL/FixJ family response regulator
MVGTACWAQTVAMPESAHGETTILIVDDDPGFGRAASEMLAARGFTVVGQAMTADEAVRACARLGPDAVLLDVRLPDGNGVTLAETLHGARDRLTILLTSTDPQAIAPERLQRSAACGFVPKTDLARTDLNIFLRR